MMRNLLNGSYKSFNFRDRELAELHLVVGRSSTRTSRVYLSFYLHGAPLQV